MYAHYFRTSAYTKLHTSFFRQSGFYDKKSEKNGIFIKNGNMKFTGSVSKKYIRNNNNNLRLHSIISVYFITIYSIFKHTIPYLQRTIPLRHKEIYGVNVHPTIKFALDFGMALISEKIRKRVRLYTAVEEVEIDKKLLPQEYGGVMPMKEMIGKSFLFFVSIENSGIIFFLTIVGSFFFP